MYLLDCIEPIFDKDGHFYLKHKDHIYEFSINKNNELEIFEIFNNDNYKFKLVNNTEDIQSLNLLSNCNTLKAKIIKEYIKEKQENPDKEFDSDEDLDNDEIQTLNTKINYNPEDLEYIDNNNNDNNDNNDDNTDDLHYISYGNNKLRVLEEEIEEIDTNIDTNILYNYTESKNLAGYDTYIYNNTENDNKLEYINKINTFLYPTRIFAYKDGSIILKIIGYPKKRYNLEINKDTGEIFLLKRI